MSSKESSALGAAPGRRRLTNEIRESLRELSVQLSVLNHLVGARVDLRPVDLNCLDVIGRHGPLSPSGLAQHTGLHPATLTGVLDRLERAGWIARDRHPSDRRAVMVRALPDRAGEIFRLYGGMNAALEEVFAGFDDGQLRTLADFLRRATGAGRTATSELTRP
jgi:DNA-binding MarR family transcriptional regulator